MMWGYGFNGGWSWIMFITMVLTWGGLLGVVVWAIYRVFPSRSDERDQREDAATILDRRFASGEIDSTTYRNAMRELSEARAELGGGTQRPSGTVSR